MPAVSVWSQYSRPACADWQPPPATLPPHAAAPVRSPHTVRLYNCLASAVRLYNCLASAVRLYNCLASAIRLYNWLASAVRLHNFLTSAVRLYNYLASAVRLYNCLASISSLRITELGLRWGSSLPRSSDAIITLIIELFIEDLCRKIPNCKIWLMLFNDFSRHKNVKRIHQFCFGDDTTMFVYSCVESAGATRTILVANINDSDCIINWNIWSQKWSCCNPALK